MVKFDGKHWIGKKRPNEPLQIHSYEHVAQQAAKSLGKNGIIAIPNARPNEYRFEEFINMWKRHSLTDIDSGKVFYDKKNRIYFVKAQEIKTRFLDDEMPITLLAYNLPHGKNLDDTRLLQVLEDSKKLDAILGLMLPSCIGSVDENILVLENYLFRQIDFVIGYSSGVASRLTNDHSINFYNEWVRGKYFTDDSPEAAHKIGITTVSGGHRTPRGKFEEFLNGGQTIGRSYTEIPEPSQNNFMKDLRQSLRNSTEKDMHCESIIIEAIKSQLSINIGDRISGLFK